MARRMPLSWLCDAYAEVWRALLHGEDGLARALAAFVERAAGIAADELLRRVWAGRPGLGFHRRFRGHA